MITDMHTEVLSTRHYKAGYEVRTERVTWGDDEVTIKQAYTVPEGHYIGDSVTAHRLIVRWGIKPEPREPTCPDANAGRGRTSTIGFCERDQKWYGWSHRGMAAFGVGDVVEKGDCAASSGQTDECPQEHSEEGASLSVGFEAKTLEDAKRIAIAFAASVS